ncbi:MAG: PilZ domain-containing protein [Cyanobium sp. LacPavin_0818_WC50_MAG_67_9]|nr:PilZ domain-containing protein [Cyanobium sp. LacPavin_0818_WC50_MAG_67_9]
MPDPSPRNEERHIVPSISMTIQVEFHFDPVPFVGRLWDVSASGACLLFPIREPVVPGLSGSLTIHHPTFGDPIRLRASSLWVDRLESASYVGVRFLERIDFEDTFLRVLMRRSGGRTPVEGLGYLHPETPFGRFG